MRFPEEAAFFARSAVFAVAIAVVYWFVSYEWAGSVLLFAFGIASALGAIMLGRAAAGRAARAHEAEPGLGADGPFGDETGPIPAPTFAPIVVAAGLALAALGMAFGPWLPLAGAMPIVLGAASWLSAANHEWRGQDTDER